MFRKNKAQSVLEYVIILTAIVAGVLVAVKVFTDHDSSVGLGKLMNQTAGKITTDSAKIIEMVK